MVPWESLGYLIGSVAGDIIQERKSRKKDRELVIFLILIYSGSLHIAFILQLSNLT